MPTRKEWARVHADLMEKLKLPCGLRFSADVRIAEHGIVEAVSHGVHIVTCRITINPKADFRVPEHLILHEAAHHRSTCYTDWECGDPHCDHWAKILCDMYRETETPLPQTTGFFWFAKAAGIVRENFAREGNNA